MLTVKANAQKSPIDGLGLFAQEDIPQGTVTWKYNPQFDISFSPEEIDTFSKIQKDFLVKYSYLSIPMQKYILCIDDSRFTNHSMIHFNVESVFDPETGESMGIAKRDILKGEEILENYRDLDAADSISNEEFLNT